MSIEIKISVPDHGYDGQKVNKASLLAEDMAALGFERRAPSPREVAEAIHADVSVRLDTDEADAPVSAEPASDAEIAAEAQTRRRRRTKAEMEAARAAEQTPNISTGGERIDPENADEAAQDAADEKAEVAASRSEKAPLTADDVRQAVTGYVNKFGMAATKEDGLQFFIEALGAPPAGEDYWKMSILPDDQTKLAKAVETWRKATELNPLKREPV